MSSYSRSNKGMRHGPGYYHTHYTPDRDDRPILPAPTPVPQEDTKPAQNDRPLPKNFLVESTPERTVLASMIGRTLKVLA